MQFLIMSETEQFFLCLRTISVFLALFSVVILAHFVLIVGLFINLRGLVC